MEDEPGRADLLQDPEKVGGAFRPNSFGPDTRHDFHVLKDGDLFAVFSASGDLNAPHAGPGEALSKDGLFFRDARYLSRLVLSLNGTPLTELGHHASADEASFRSDLANSCLVDGHGTEFVAFALHVQRDRFLSDGLYDRIVITNYALATAELDLVFDIWADFRDVFEVRGATPTERGELQPPVYADGRIEFSYHAADGRRLGTRVVIDPEPVLEAGRARLALSVPPKTQQEIACVVRVAEQPGRPQVDEAALGARHGGAEFENPSPRRDQAHSAMSARVAHRIARTARIATSRPNFDAWLARSSADLAMLTSELVTGPYPYAGVPWFAAPFGRDGIVAALQTLWLDAALAGGVLDFLAATQATAHDAFYDAEPGKILHEHRNGEMARIGAVPFHHYYGGIDQTLLFVMLAHAYWMRTADRERMSRLEPSIRAALGWAAAYGDRDRDGFIEYARSAETGLRNQGWKDSEDAVFHANGTLCVSPVALVEVQGYHAAALRAAADIFEVLDSGDESSALRRQADDLVRQIDLAFWDEDLGTYCIALDADNRPVRVSTSNAGHLLFCDAVLPERRDRLIDTLTSPLLRSGWGIRTVSTEAARYNPMGYHNGSIWPHDNSIIAAGLARAGRPDVTAEVTAELFEASRHFPEHRLPELWCGLSRTESSRPVAYPSACSPQAWAAGAPFLCLQACLGLSIDAPAKRLLVAGPVLPDGVDRLDLHEIRIGNKSVSLRFCRDADGAASVETIHADGGLNVEVRPSSDLRQPAAP
jgi:glycogen debranching enzyme